MVQTIISGQFCVVKGKILKRKPTQILSVSLFLTFQIQQTVANPQDPHVQGTGRNLLALAVPHQYEAIIQHFSWAG